jgi:LysM repeat protein
MFGRFTPLFCFVFLFLGFHAVVLAAPLASMDSIGVQKVGDRTFIVHQVVGQETLFSVSRRYKVSMSEIQQANESLKQGMKDGQTLLVPFGQPSSSSSTSVSTPSTGLTSVPTANPPAQTQSSETTDNQTTTKVAVEPVATASTPVKNEKPTAVTPTEPVVAASSKPAAEVTIQKVKSTHKVKSGENLSSIAKKYKVTVAELKSWNSLTSDKVMIGQSLKIISKQAVAVKQSNTEPQAEPLAAKTAVKEEVKKEAPKQEVIKTEEPNGNKEVVFVSTKTSPSTTKAEGGWTSHTVKAGESLFLLSKQYGASIEELIQWNALTSNNLKVGQTIKVGRAASESIPVPVVAEVKNQPTTTVAPVQQPQETTVPNTSTNTSGGFTNTKESGLAEVIPGTEASKKYLVLHRNAPVGSVIRVKNEENDLTIFARVVGVLPETGDNSKVLIKLSQAAFEQLKGVNTRFPVEILY